MIGKLIPAGTGMKLYSDVQVDYGEYSDFVNGKEPEEEEEELTIAGLEKQTIASDDSGEEIKVYGVEPIVE